MLPQLILFFVSMMVVMGPPDAFAENWHRGAGLSCGYCHPGHRSEGLGASIPSWKGDLSSTSLCLRCHDGSQLAAPGVLAPSGRSRPVETAGGFFERGWGPSGKGHDLGVRVGLAGVGSIVLTCISCHDPHGNANYKDLRPRPMAGLRGGGRPADPGGVRVTARKREGSKNQGYGGRNPTLYQEGISRWCEECHQDFYGGQRARGPSHHPVEVAVSKAAINPGEMLPLFFSSAPLPVEDPQGNTVYGPNPSGADDDRVSCLTCHYAHGGENPKALRYADGTSLDSTCRQCHPKGQRGEWP